MRISRLQILNFRGVRETCIEDPGRMVIIAGQNGSGKSCVFDAIRIVKSAYGGYQPNEWQQWLGEFQIRLTNNTAEPNDFVSMFNDSTRPAIVQCHFELCREELAYLSENGAALIRNAFRRDAQGGGPVGRSSSPFLDPSAASERQLKVQAAELLEELSRPSLLARLEFRPNALPIIVPSPALSAIFSTYRPESIGIIDYHGPHRNYGREYVNTINFNITDSTTKRSQSALYNYSNKYANVKSEMAASYVNEVLAEQAGVPRASQVSLTNTLKELFATFFPDKTFLGPTPTPAGSIEFNVQLSNGKRHDIDELSAGEKEIIYGYLRIRNSAPKNSIILIDEPELHLNPKLIRDLPAFYKKHLGEDANNQIWLVTHSDALLREVVGINGYDVYHMLPAASVAEGEYQLKPLSIRRDLDAALIDLVGDLAAYHPSGKVVLFEGGGDSNFDKRVVGDLFPELARLATFISGTSKAKVSALHDVLNRAVTEGDLPFKFYSITDADGNLSGSPESVTSFEWDVYHIENYFLEPRYIRLAMEDLGNENVPSEHEILSLMRECAKGIRSELLQQRLGSYANSLLVKQINTKCSPISSDVANDMFAAVQRSFLRLDGVRSESLSQSALLKASAGFLRTIDADLESEAWMRSFPGRSILKRFVKSHVATVNYDAFLMLLLSRMKNAGHKPPGMAKIVAKISKN